MRNMKLCRLQLALCNGTKSSRQHKKLFLAPSRGAGRLQRSSFLVYILSLKPAAEASNGHESGADLLDHLNCFFLARYTALQKLPLEIKRMYLNTAGLLGTVASQSDIITSCFIRR